MGGIGIGFKMSSRETSIRKTKLVLKNMKIKIETVLPIVQGLLASGHFTYPEEESADHCAGVLFEKDAKDEWKEMGYARKYPSQVVEAAIKLAQELQDQIELDNAS